MIREPGGQFTIAERPETHGDLNYEIQCQTCEEYFRAKDTNFCRCPFCETKRAGVVDYTGLDELEEHLLTDRSRNTTVQVEVQKGFLFFTLLNQGVGPSGKVLRSTLSLDKGVPDKEIEMFLSHFLKNHYTSTNVLKDDYMDVIHHLIEESEEGE